MKIIAIGGVPGTGKTTLIRKLLNENFKHKELRKLVTGMVSDDLIILGDYSDSNAVFAGTDKFSMAVQPEAEKFFDETTKNVVFEGDRIFNSKMLEYIQQKHNLLILIIETNDSLLSERYKQRGSDQSEKFINGRKTKYENVKKNPNLTVYTHQHNNDVDTTSILNGIDKFLTSGTITFDKFETDTLDDFFS